MASQDRHGRALPDRIGHVDIDGERVDLELHRSDTTATAGWRWVSITPDGVIAYHDDVYAHSIIEACEAALNRWPTMHLVPLPWLPGGEEIRRSRIYGD